MTKSSVVDLELDNGTLHAALYHISQADPQSDTCGPHAPEHCENECIGCMARAALKAVDNR